MNKVQPERIAKMTDAVPSIVRASQVDVAGDRNQLPPTAFFVADDDEPEYNEEEVPSGTAGFESLLDTMNVFIRSRPLDWHYRSRDESLISFSNHHIYGGRLVTFPGQREDRGEVLGNRRDLR